MIFGLVALMAVYFMRVDSIVDPKGGAAFGNVYEEMEEEEGLYRDLPGTTATIVEEDTSRSNDSCR